MGLKSCKPRNSCLRCKEECRPAGGCSCVCDDWQSCSECCCDICCQMCVDVCCGLCSGDCSYTFCTLCLGLAQNCVAFFTTQQTETPEVQLAVEPSYLLLYNEGGDEKHNKAERDVYRNNGHHNKPKLIAALMAEQSSEHNQRSRVPPM